MSTLVKIKVEGGEGSERGGGESQGSKAVSWHWEHPPATPVQTS